MIMMPIWEQVVRECDDWILDTPSRGISGAERYDEYPASAQWSLADLDPNAKSFAPS